MRGFEFTRMMSHRIVNGIGQRVIASHRGKQFLHYSSATGGNTGSFRWQHRCDVIFFTRKERIMRRSVTCAAVLLVGLALAGSAIAAPGGRGGAGMSASPPSGGLSNSQPSSHMNDQGADNGNGAN